MAKTFKDSIKKGKIIFQAERPRKLKRILDTDKFPIRHLQINFDDNLREKLLKRARDYFGVNYASFDDLYNDVNIHSKHKNLFFYVTENESGIDFKFYKHYYYDVGCVFTLESNEKLKKLKNRDQIFVYLNYFSLLCRDYLRYLSWHYDKILEMYQEDIDQTYDENDEEHKQMSKEKEEFSDYLADTENIISDIFENYQPKTKIAKSLLNDINIFKEKYMFVYDNHDINDYNPYVIIDDSTFDFILMVPDYEDMSHYMLDMIESNNEHGIHILFKSNTYNDTEISCNFINDLNNLHTKIMDVYGN